MMKSKRPARVFADPEKWSDSSKRSMAYEFGRDEYVDIHYLCFRCGVRAIYPACDQRIDYEVLGVYIARRRILCEACWNQRVATEERIHICESKWKAGSQNCRSDEGFLNAWLSDLEALPFYAGKRNRAHIAMLRRLLGIPA